MAWTITWEGEVYRETDLTLDQIERIEVLCGSTWLSIAPLRSARHARSILTVVLADRLNLAQDEAHKRVGSIKADEFIDAMQNEPLDDQLDLPEVFEDGLPKAVDEPSTP